MSEFRALNAGEHTLIGDIIADSFSDDPVNLWVFGSTANISAYYAFAAKQLYLRQGFGHVMQNGSGGALWLPSGISKKIPIWNSLGIGWKLLKTSGIKPVFRGMQVDDCLAKKAPKTPYIYLFALAARQAFQGQGVGSALINEGLNRADKLGLPVYLENSKEANIGYYQRFGFHVLEQLSPAPGSPPMWRMLRPVHASNEYTK